MTAIDTTDARAARTRLRVARATTLGDRYVFQLTDAHVAELDAALVHAESRADDVLDITREPFPLPTLGAGARAASTHELIDGRGVVLIRGVPVERYGKERASSIYWGIGMHLGAPVAAERQGSSARRRHRPGPGHRRPDRRAATRSAASRSRSTPTAPISSACSASTPGASGGASLVANAVTIHNELVRTAPELAAELYAPFPYDLRGEQAPGAQALVHDADLQPAAATGCSCATSARTSSRRAATTTRPARRTRRARRWTASTRCAPTRSTTCR